MELTIIKSDNSIEIIVTTNADSRSISFRESEQEDNTFHRDLSDVYNIEHLITMAYEAGKNNEEIDTIYLYESEED